LRRKWGFGFDLPEAGQGFGFDLPEAGQGFSPDIQGTNFAGL
jgi:hypothetical protein